MTQAKKTKFIPDIANNTGYIYERIGNVKAATEYYHKAFEAAIKAEEPSRNLMAKTLDNLSRAYCQQGLFAEAQSYIDQAIKIWKNLIKEESQIARGEITQGVIYRDLGKYNEAVGCIERAIKHLHEPDDHQKLIKAFFHLGLTKYFQAVEAKFPIARVNGLEEARRKFERSRKLAEQYYMKAELPSILHQKSKVYHQLGKKKEAVETNDEAYELSKEVHDIRSAVDSLVGKAEFDYDNGQYDRIPEYAKELTEEYENKEYEFPQFYGRMRLIQADIAFKREQHDVALKNYIKGIAQIRQHSGYGMYSIDKELARLEKRLSILPRDVATESLIHMRQEWAQMEPADKYLSILSWCDQEIVNLQLMA